MKLVILIGALSLLAPISIVAIIADINRRQVIVIGLVLYVAVIGTLLFKSGLFSSEVTLPTDEASFLDQVARDRQARTCLKQSDPAGWVGSIRSFIGNSSGRSGILTVDLGSDIVLQTRTDFSFDLPAAVKDRSALGLGSAIKFDAKFIRDSGDCIKATLPASASEDHQSYLVDFTSIENGRI